MPMSAICAQRLRHHAVAALAVDNSGMLLLFAGDTLEPTGFGHVPVSMARDEFTEILLQKKLGQSGRLAEIGAIYPSAATLGGVLTVYAASFSPAMLAALANSELVAVSAEALPQLSDLWGPVLRLVLAEFGHKIFEGT